MKKILIVEDDFALGDMMRMLLKAKGYDVHVARDGAAGLEAARAVMPDVVLLDANIPKMDGFDVCRTLRSDEKTANIKIIMATGLGRVCDVDHAFASGAADYIVKPINNERLLKKIEKVLQPSPES